MKQSTNPASKKQREHKYTKLRNIRKERGLTQTKLSEISGVPVQSILNYEQRIREIDSASLVVLLDLCLSLKCTLSDIMEDEDKIEKLEKVLNIPSLSIQSSAAGSHYQISREKYLIEKYFYTDSVPELSPDQKAGIAFVSKDFPVQWKDVLELRYMEGLTLAQIAANKGITGSRVGQLVKNAIKRLEEYETSEFVILGLQAAKQQAEKEKEDLLWFDRPIDELGLSGKAYNCLMRAGFTTIGSAVLARKDLINIKNVGPAIVAEICERIDAYTKDFISKG